VLLAMTADMEEVCPDVTFLNYVNPMAMNTWAIYRASRIKTIGLCHSVQGTASQLAKDIGVPAAEINYICAGINHMAFYLTFERRNADGEVEDLYPRIREVADSQATPERVHGTGIIPDAVRYDMFRRLGYFVTESSEHFSEYVPWFIKGDRPDLVEAYGIPLDEYIHRCQLQIEGWQGMRDYLENSDTPLNISRSHEYGSGIIHSMETGQPRVVYGNVENDRLIDNLPQGCCVEVPCLVDKNGVQPTRVGALPPQLAALMQTNVNVQALAVEAALTRKREHIYHAAMLDPHTAAELDLDQIWSLIDELIEAHGEWLPAYH
jgi:alpha-galactosidase